MMGNRIHFAGIGGAGMSSLAQITRQLGYEVSGSDQQLTARTDRLAALGVTIYEGHFASQIGDSTHLVYSSAIAQNNPEMLAAKSKGLCLMHRATWLAALVKAQAKHLIAVTGSHGKSTVTSLIGHLLAKLAIDPMVLVGADVNAWQSNARFGQGGTWVLEADESDASFQQFTPEIAVITNLDRDHMDTYGQSEAELHRRFRSFLENLPKTGIVLACGDDSQLRALCSGLPQKVVFYGLGKHNDLFATAITPEVAGCRFVPVGLGYEGGAVSLPLFGQYQVQNALAALAVGLLYQGYHSVMANALRDFAGVSRRGSISKHDTQAYCEITVLDDYAHHPTEIQALWQAVNAWWPERPILMLFQPHRYTRTRDLGKEFANVLQACSHLGILPIYAASEKALPGITSEKLVAQIRAAGGQAQLCNDLVDVFDFLKAQLQPNSVIMIVGAGSIGTYVQPIQRWLASL